MLYYERFLLRNRIIQKSMDTYFIALRSVFAKIKNIFWCKKLFLRILNIGLLYLFFSPHVDAPIICSLGSKLLILHSK